MLENFTCFAVIELLAGFPSCMQFPYVELQKFEVKNRYGKIEFENSRLPSFGSAGSSAVGAIGQPRADQR